MKFPTQIEYLRNSGVLNTGTSADIAEEKRQYRKEYLAYKKREHRKKNRSVTLTYSNKQMRLLQEEAENHNMRVPEYLRACVKVAREQAYIVPNIKKVEQIEILLKRVGTHTNQIARLANQMTLPPTRAIAELREHLQYFEETFDTMFRRPKNVHRFIKETLSENPAFAKKLLLIVASHLETNVAQDPSS